MLNSIEKRILDFTRLTGLTERHEMVHGTLYVTLVQPEEFDHFHRVIRTFYKDNINPDGGVNMYAVGDEFCFDFVPEDREAPVFAKEDEQEKGVWSEFAEEDLYKNIPDDVEVMLNLEAEAKEGR
jgi:hypothetical protein